MSNNIQLHKNDLPDDLNLGNIIAVDGEFMGLNVRRDPLCLIQISSGNSDAHIVQFDRKNYKAPNLVKLLMDENITKIFHYARADMAHIKYYLNTETENILDTKIASKLVRTYTDKHGLKDLCKELLDKDLNKTQQSSDWSAKELSSNQLKYASNDVIFLIELKQILQSMLKREGRYELSQKLFSFLSTRVDLDFLGWNDIDIFSH